MIHLRILGTLLLIAAGGCGHSAPPTGRVDSTDGPVSSEWPFDDAQNLAVITLDRIMSGSEPILIVSHDLDDGGWQFLDGADVSESDAIVVSLKEVAVHDPSVKELADLPLGWRAVRDTVGGPWHRSQNGQ